MNHSEQKQVQEALVVMAQAEREIERLREALAVAERGCKTLSTELSAERANTLLLTSTVEDLTRRCDDCTAFTTRIGASNSKLLAVANELIAWSKTVDVVSGSKAAEQLCGITERARLAADEARAN